MSKDDVRRVTETTGLRDDVIWIPDDDDSTHALTTWKYHEEREAEIERLREALKEADDAFAKIESAERKKGETHLGGYRVSGIEKGCILCIAWFARSALLEVSDG